MAEEDAVTLTIPHQKQLEYIADKLQKLVSDLKQKLTSSEVNDDSKASITEEEWQLKIQELKKLIEGQDGTAVDICQALLTTVQLSDDKKATLEKIKNLLDEFEFDEALELL